MKLFLIIIIVLVVYVFNVILGCKNIKTTTFYMICEYNRYKMIILHHVKMSFKKTFINETNGVDKMDNCSV